MKPDYRAEIELLIVYLQIDSLIKSASVIASTISNVSRRQAYLELASACDKEIDAYTTVTQETDFYKRNLVKQIWFSRIEKRREAFRKYAGR